MESKKHVSEPTVLPLGDESKTPSLQDASSLASDEGTRESHAACTRSKVSRARGVAMIVSLSGISFLNTMGSGILIAALPRIAKDVGLDKSLILVSPRGFLLLLPPSQFWAETSEDTSDSRDLRHCTRDKN